MMSKAGGYAPMSTQSGYSGSQTHGPVDGTIDGEYDSTISGSGSLGPVVPGDFGPMVPFGGTATLKDVPWAKWC